MKVNNDIFTYLKEIEELALAEFGNKELPNPYHNFMFNEEEVMILYFALKHYLTMGISEGTSGKLTITITKLMEGLLPRVQEFTQNKIDALNKLKPEALTNNEQQFFNGQ